MRLPQPGEIIVRRIPFEFPDDIQPHWNPDEPEWNHMVNGAGLWVAAILVGWMYMFMLLGEIELFPIIPSIDVKIPGEARAWNMAHLEGITNGLLLMAIAALAPLLTLSDRQHRLLFWSAVITAWGFTLPAWANALAGTRGLAFDGGPFRGGLANSIIYMSGWPAVVAVHVVFVLLLLGAFNRLRVLRSHS